MKTSDFPYFMYYAPPDDGTAALSTNGAAAGRPTSSKPTKGLSEAIAAFKAAHITGRRAKLMIKGAPSMGGFSVFGMRKSTLEKLPKEFQGYTTGGVGDNGRHHC